MSRLGLYARMLLVGLLAAGWAARPVTAQAPVVVTMMEFIRAEERDWQRAVVHRFNTARSDIQIELVTAPGTNAEQKMLTMLAAGMPPDIGYHDPPVINVWGRQGIARDLRPFLENEGPDSPFHEFFPGAMELFNVDGRQFGIPIDLQAQAWFFAEAPFEEAGLPYPDASMTWEELARWARVLSVDRDGNGSIDRWAMSFPQWRHWMSIIWSFGADFVDDEKRPTRFVGASPEMEYALAFMRELSQDHRIMAPPRAVPDGTGENITLRQNIVMALGSSIYMQAALAWEPITGVRWNVTRLPMGPDGARPSLANSLGWFIFTQSEHPEAAWEVIRYFSSEEALSLAVAMRGTLVPHRLVAIEDWLTLGISPKDRRVFIDAMLDVTRGVPNVTGTGLTAIVQSVEGVVAGSLTIPQAIEAMRVGVTNWIREQGDAE